MTTAYPTNLDALSNPTGDQSQGAGPRTHSQQHSDLNDAVEALQTRVGADTSPGDTSLRGRDGAQYVGYRGSGVGAAVRTVLAKLREQAVCITDYAANPSAIVAGLEDTAPALVAAQAALPSTGGVIEFPAGTYRFDSTGIVGDAPASLPSVLNGVTLRGRGTGRSAQTMNAFSGATVFQYNGTTGGTLLRVQGPISGVCIEDICLDGNAKAATLLEVQRAFHSTFRRILGVRWKNGYALVLNANSALVGYGGAAPIGQVWDQVELQDPDVGACGVDIGSGNGNLNQILFTRCYLDRYNSTSTVSLRLGYCDHINFVGCHLAQTGASGSTGIGICVRPQTGLGNFPSNITFTGTAMAGGVQHDSTLQAWSGANVFPALIFQPFYTADGAPLPPKSANAGADLPGGLARGWTDNGIDFGWFAETQEVIAAAGTIAPKKRVVLLTAAGDTTINTITVPRAAFSVPNGGYSLRLLFSGTDTVTLGSSGNIATPCKLTNLRAVDLVYSEGTGYWTVVGATGGVYTPTLNNTTNVSASTARECVWTYAGGIVRVSGRAEVTTTAGGDAATVLDVSLPITPETFGQTWDCAGNVTVAETVYRAGLVIGQGTVAKLQWQSAAASAKGVIFDFAYKAQQG